MEKTGIELIAIERQEQVEKHGRTIKYDVKNNNHYQLSEAAGLLTSVDMDDLQVLPHECCPTGWDEQLWEQMFSKSYKKRLIIAGALIAAEIDRLKHL
jgi:hypothetical protein